MSKLKKMLIAAGAALILVVVAVIIIKCNNKEVVEIKDNSTKTNVEAPAVKK